MHPLGSRFVYQEAGENVLIKKKSHNHLQDPTNK